MAIALNGTVIHACDVATDFATLNSGSNISGDDDFVEGAGAVGDKMSNTNEILAADTLLGGAAGVYDFSVGGTNEGWHGIGWVNTKTPINATTGIQAYIGNAAGHTGSINVMPSYFYKGGFTTRVWNPTADFTTASTWTTTGNPAQLDDVTIFGFEFTTITTIMGSFNNCQVDQFTFGLGVRADAGTLGVPNVYQDVIDQDQDTSFWGWHSSSGAKGGLYIGPATGTTASWFVDSAFSIRFLDENVATGFYGIFIRGANTTCDFTLASISAENPTNSRWSLLLDSAMGDTTGGFTDTNGTYVGYDQITLNANATLTGTTLIDGNLITQTGSTLTGITVIEANLTSGSATLGHAVLSDNPTLITASAFEQGSNPGHAVRCDTVGSYNWSNTDTGYTGTRGSNPTSSTGSNNAMFYNNSGGLITLTVTGAGDSPSVRNGAGATTVVVAGAVTTAITVQDINDQTLLAANVYLQASDGTGDLPFNDSVTITSVTTVATVAHTAHGFVVGNKVKISGANEQEYNGAKTIVTVPTANSYTYTVDAAVADTATGTITATGLIFADVANGTGVSPSTGIVSDTRTFSGPQPVSGRARLSTTPGSLYKNAPITGTINSSTGLTITVQLIPDE